MCSASWSTSSPRLACRAGSGLSPRPPACRRPAPAAQPAEERIREQKMPQTNTQSKVNHRRRLELAGPRAAKVRRNGLRRQQEARCRGTSGTTTPDQPNKPSRLGGNERKRKLGKNERRGTNTKLKGGGRRGAHGGVVEECARAYQVHLPRGAVPPVPLVQAEHVPSVVRRDPRCVHRQLVKRRVPSQA